MEQPADAVSEKGHTFLEYLHTEVHFIYGFLWQSIANVRPTVFREGLMEDRSGWISPLVHERVIGDLPSSEIESRWVGAYQPTFELEKRCLEKSGLLTEGAEPGSQAYLVSPMGNGINLPSRSDAVDGQMPRSRSDLKLFPVLGSWTIRLFDTGAGILTFRICLKNLANVSDRGARFSRIHHLLRLVPNMDNAPESHSGTSVIRDGPVADSFLFLPMHGTCRLFDLMRFFRDKALSELPRAIFEDAAPDDARVFADESMFAHAQKQHQGTNQLKAFSEYPSGNWNENQTPFVFVTGVVSGEVLACLRDPPPQTVKEIASIFARLTLDNRRARKDFAFLSEDYIRRALDVDHPALRIRNVSHDERMFVAFSKRGAIALTSEPEGLPSVFVIPSILNLFEIMRARLFAAVAVEARLTEFASKLARSEPAESRPVDFRSYLQLRQFVVLNLSDPLQYLFDGGSTTELAIAADRALGANEVWDRVRRTFDVVDHLVNAWEIVRFRSRLNE